MSENLKIENVKINAALQPDNQTAAQYVSSDTKSSLPEKKDENELVCFEEETKTKESENASSDNAKLNELQTRQKNELVQLAIKQQEKSRLIKKQASLVKRLVALNEEDEKWKANINSQISSVKSDINELDSDISQCINNLFNIQSQMNTVSLAQTSGNTVSTGAQTSQIQNSQIQTAAFDSNNNITSVNSNGSIPSDLAKRLDSKLGSGFSAKCEQVSSKLNCNPNDLLAMMYSESGLNPHVQGYNGAVGLIQFMPSVLSSYGYSQNQVKNMSAVEQLDVVYDILAKSKSISGLGNGKLDAGSLYAICFLPAYAKNEVLCSKNNSKTSWAYKANSPLDIDKDGNISKSDLAKRLNAKYLEMNANF